MVVSFTPENATGHAPFLSPFFFNGTNATLSILSPYGVQKEKQREFGIFYGEIRSTGKSHKRTKDRHRLEKNAKKQHSGVQRTKKHKRPQQDNKHTDRRANLPHAYFMVCGLCSGKKKERLKIRGNSKKSSLFLFFFLFTSFFQGCWLSYFPHFVFPTDRSR